MHFHCCSLSGFDLSRHSQRVAKSCFLKCGSDRHQIWHNPSTAFGDRTRVTHGTKQTPGGLYFRNPRPCRRSGQPGVQEEQELGPRNSGPLHPTYICHRPGYLHGCSGLWQ
ncbi:hypothetical protein M3J09_002669 [Ascochyta lentis]